MRLKITDFAKIKDADMKIDGITVIAGENNTGKSTVGKILFSLFNALSDIDSKIEEQRVAEIEESTSRAFRDYIAHKNISRNMISHKSYITVKQIGREIKKLVRYGEITDEKISQSIEKNIDINFKNKNDIDDSNIMHDLKENLKARIRAILNLPEDAIVYEILSRNFESVFNGQINSLLQPGTSACLDLNIKGKNISVVFYENGCVNCAAEIALLNKAVYIDNPFVIDGLEGYPQTDAMGQQLVRILTRDLSDDLMDGIIDTILVKEKLNEIYQMLDSIVGGQIIKQTDGRYYLQKEGFEQPVFINNLSTGLKSFVIIKMLLEKGAIHERDVLILDEPEIHLHPQWQIAYAELIVLLQKYFDLSIIITTHSPYFLDAINLFSVKYGLDSKVNYYLSSMKDNCVKINCVTGNIDSAYDKMATPIQMLDSLRYELNNN